MNAVGQLTEVTLPQGDRNRLQYDAAGYLAEVTHPSGGVTRYERDPMGNALQVIDAAGNSQTNTYDIAGRLLTSTDPRGQTTTYDYNKIGQLVRKTLADARVIEYRYTPQGFVSRVDDGEFPVVYEYDKHGRRTSITYPAIKQKLGYAYDEDGRLSGFTDTAGNALTYRYGDHKRVVGIKVADVGEVLFEYDAKGRRTGVDYPNGVRGTTTYDSRDRPEKLFYLNADKKVVGGWAYQYDAAGNCLQVSEVGSPKRSYRYDAEGQLLEEAGLADRTVGYAYSAGGNRKAKIDDSETHAYTVDQADRMTIAGDDVLTYDDAGNLTLRKNAQGETRYQYNAENRLAKVVLPSGEEVEYGYAPTGERVWRSDAQGKVYYLTDGKNLLAELDASFQVIQKYVHAPGIDRPLLMRQGDAVTFFHADRRGNVARLTDTKGQTTARYQYDAFGNVVNHTGESESPFLFTGRTLDSATGLYHLRAREYDPQQGRFASVDPAPVDLEDPLNLNPYLYARNNPMRYADPLGTRHVPMFDEPTPAPARNDDMQNPPSTASSWLMGGAVATGGTYAATRSPQTVASRGGSAPAQPATQPAPMGSPTPRVTPSGSLPSGSTAPGGQRLVPDPNRAIPGGGISTPDSGPGTTPPQPGNIPPSDGTGLPTQDTVPPGNNPGDQDDDEAGGSGWGTAVAVGVVGVGVLGAGAVAVGSAAAETAVAVGAAGAGYSPYAMPPSGYGGVGADPAATAWEIFKSQHRNLWTHLSRVMAGLTVAGTMGGLEASLPATIGALLLTEALSVYAEAAFVGESGIFLVGLIAASVAPLVPAIVAAIRRATLGRDARLVDEDKLPPKKEEEEEEEPLVTIDPDERERVAEQDETGDDAEELVDRLTERERADTEREAGRLDSALTQAEWDRMVAERERIRQENEAWWAEVDARNQQAADDWHDHQRRADNWQRAADWYDNFQRTMGSDQRWTGGGGGGNEDHHQPNWKRPAYSPF